MVDKFRLFAELEGSFRGHLLNGKEMTVPEGYKGVTLSEHKKPDSETEDRSLHVTGAFSQFTYWNFDKIPSDSDALKRALDWIDIAKVVSGVQNFNSYINGFYEKIK